MSSGIVYLDSSAIIKLVFDEVESPRLHEFLADYPLRASTTLARIEVVRTAGRVRDPLVVRGARGLMRGLRLIRPDESLLAAAEDISPATLRTFDAIHLVTALSLRPAIAGMVVYDRVLSDAAEAAGLTVFAPA